MAEHKTTASQGSEPWLARSTMHTAYGRLARMFFEWLFGPIHYPAASAEQLRELSRQGVLVYVTPHGATLLTLYFNHALARLRLPLPHFVGGVNLLLWQPVSRLLKLWSQRRRLDQSTQPPPAATGEAPSHRPPTRSEALLTSVLLRSESAFIVLPRQTPGQRQSVRHDYVRALVAAQKASERTIYLVPHILTDRALSGSGERGITDVLFGDVRRPGRLRLFVMFLAALRRATVRVGEPVNLKQLIAQLPDGHENRDNDHDDAIVASVTNLLNERIVEEERVIAGPELPDRKTVASHVLQNPNLLTALDRECERSGMAREAVRHQAARNLWAIAARYNVAYIRFLDRVLGPLFNRIYDGLVIDETGLQRLIEASRRGPVIYCPSHRSHIDYLILSYVLWQHGVAPPHIAAGANLAFFPLGTIFRGSGAFFMRRNFRDDPVYAAVFKAYIAELLRVGTSIEFFPEGTRSRTGKVLMPRFGMFGMMVDAWRAGARDDILFAPVSIDYEQIIEAGSYEKELSGGKKSAENIGGLLRSTRILRSRYGRVHLQFGDPISLSDLAADAQLPRSTDEEHNPAWRRETERLAYRVVHGITRVASVTPTAVVSTALLGHQGRGIARQALLDRSIEIVEFLDTAAARMSDALQLEHTRVAAVRTALQRLIDDGLVTVERPGRSDAEPIYKVVEQRRITVDIYKNSLMNYFAPSAIACRCMLRRKSAETLNWEQLQDDSRFLSRLLKCEFIYPVDAKFDTHFTDTVTSLAVRGVLNVGDDGSIEVQDLPTVEWLAGLLDSFIEAYWVTAGTLGDLRTFPLRNKELQARTRERCRRAFLEGSIRRPEATNSTLVKSAITAMVKAGVISSKIDGKHSVLSLTEEFSAEALDELTDEIAAYLE